MKMKKKHYIIVVVLILIGFLVFNTGQKETITCGESITRTSSPTIVLPGESFTLTYTVNGASGAWGASVVDTVAGGCTYPDGSASYKSVMLSPDGLTKSITVTAPSSGVCAFAGDAKFGECGAVDMGTFSVSICTPTCTRPANLCIEANTIGDNCGGYCGGSWTVQQLISTDSDCNNMISFTEIQASVSSWLSSSMTRDDLGKGIQNWVLQQ